MTLTSLAPVRAHVRRPDLPWRTAAITECGLQVTEVVCVIDREDLRRRLRTDGQRRTSYDVCITCMDTAGRWPTFEINPVEAMRREFSTHRPDPRLANELRALAALATEHRVEFEAALQGLRDVARLDEARIARRRRHRAVPDGRT